MAIIYSNTHVLLLYQLMHLEIFKRAKDIGIALQIYIYIFRLMWLLIYHVHSIYIIFVSLKFHSKVCFQLPFSSPFNTVQMVVSIRMQYYNFNTNKEK